VFTSLILGESHTGKTQSLGTLPGRTIIFNLEPPDNITSLKVPYQECLRLKAFWEEKKEIGRILVVQYGALPREISLQAAANPQKQMVQALIEDLNTVPKHSGEVDNLAIEALGALGEGVLDFIVASNNRKDTQIQDYKVARAKLQEILGATFSLGKNVILTGHLQSEKDEITGRGRITPLIWGKDLPSSIPRLFGEVFQSTVIADGKGGIAYKWLTQPDPAGFLTFLGSRKLRGLTKYVEQDFGYLGKLQEEREKELEKLKGGEKK